MISAKCFLRFWIIALVILLAIILLGNITVQAQYWAATAPYNLLWPLWSPALSPVDTFSGLPTPLLGQVTNTTVLPVQPIMLWDPAMTFPWLLYNIPPVLGGGLTFFDPYYGMNPWPPSYLLDPLTSPIPLPLGYDLLSPFSISDFGPSVTTGNLYYATQYPAAQFGISLNTLLTPANIWGLPAL